MNSLHNLLLDAIKNDELSTFCDITTNKRGCFAFAYGRFPILTICYLYNSKKIIKKFEKQLLAVQSYTIVDEDIEVYRKFRERANKSLRLYLADNSIVSPLEMLAILEQSILLIELYPLVKKSGQVVENIQKIYRLNHQQDISQQDNSIAIKKKKLPPLQKLAVYLSVVASIAMICLTSSLWVALHCVFGNGTINSPHRIFSASQLAIASQKEGGNYILTKDITLSSNWQATDFLGNLNGNGKTIYVDNSKINNSLFSTFSGKIHDVTFKFSSLDSQFSSNLGLVIQTNEGTLENVHIDVGGQFVKLHNEEDLETFLALLVFENNGNVFNCSVSCDISVNGDGMDTFFSSLVAINNGVLDNCFSTINSTIKTDTVDVAGLVAVNTAEAIVSNCTNNATITQQSASSSWLPHASGLVTNNEGEISNCFNFGTVSAISTADESQLSVYVAGIVGTNSGIVYKCKNESHLIAESQQYHLYLGGICATNALGGIISNSCAYGTFSAYSTQSENIYKFIGGICGQNDFKIENSYTLYTAEQTQKHSYFGGIVGLTALSVVSMEYAKNNYYIPTESIQYGSATLYELTEYIIGNEYKYNIDIYDDSRIAENYLNQGSTKQNGLEQLQGKEVYWA